MRHPQLVQTAETGIQGTWKRLASGNEGPSPTSTISVVFFGSLLVFHKRLDDLLNVSNVD
jgi:hypothetical protein